MARKKMAEGITFPKGFSAGGVFSGVKKNGKPDLALILCESECVAAGVFTTNQIKAPAVRISQRRVRGSGVRAVIVNSGNANACNGEQGERDALQISEKLSGILGCDPRKILMASTGVIGRPLNMKAILSSLPNLVAGTDPFGNEACAQAIMTTDTRSKSAQAEATINGHTVRVGGIAKGVGMIHPQMATLLVFLTTDACVEKAALRSALGQASDRTFNALTVDGDTSTNDTALILASGQAGNGRISRNSSDFEAFCALVQSVCESLRDQLVRDGEGVTKIIRIQVSGARSRGDARKVAQSISRSLLVKTAFFGEDVNWGRIMVAIGNSGVRVFEERIDIFMGPVALVHKGVGLGPLQEEKALEVMKGKEITLRVMLGLGSMEAEYWTTDLSLDYVRINAGYKGRT
ncbi:MAG: bifunctional glutamate N-acetyltransferase/amino-acid acetyltransferase ArgJ [Nitrospiraceae bacterium]|nr:bifunctional glutamate N-acetyltransferase/amino-acid acetyltransferase ArgJ [Nitrospiraceae bacterium]